MSENKTQNNAPRGPMGGPGMMRGMMPGAKAKDFKGTMKKLISYLGSHRWTILFVWLLAVISTTFTILGPKILGNATNELVDGFMRQISGTGSIDFTKIGSIILWAGWIIWNKCDILLSPRLCHDWCNHEDNL